MIKISSISIVLSNIIELLASIFGVLGIGFYFFRDYLFKILVLFEFIIIIFLLLRGYTIKPNIKNIKNL